MPIAIAITRVIRNFLVGFMRSSKSGVYPSHHILEFKVSFKSNLFCGRNHRRNNKFADFTRANPQIASIPQTKTTSVHSRLDCDAYESAHFLKAPAASPSELV